jgi:unsaturated chondroitin disaccharide hydrolase
MIQQQEFIRRGEFVFEFAARQLRRLVDTRPGLAPAFTSRGRWVEQEPGWTRWTEGFLGGQLWLVYQASGEEWFREQAERACLLIEARKADRSVHDLGFLFWPTWKAWYDLTGDETKKSVVIEAGRTLAGRFQERGGYLCSFQGAHSLYIDIMMNVGLVFYAAQQTGSDELMRIAIDHCLTNRRRLVRGDGSTAHEGLFSLQTGEFLGQSTQQGWRSDSTWARGLCWALCGFGTAYQFSRDERFLSTAELLAEFYLRHTPEDGVPPNDWDEPNPKYPYESSAAAIAAGGLWQLAELTGDAAGARRYRQAALGILQTLASPEFLADENTGWEGLLKHGIYHLPAGVGVDESLSWGDYYFLLALAQALHSLREDKLTG